MVQQLHSLNFYFILFNPEIFMVEKKGDFFLLGYFFCKVYMLDWVMNPHDRARPVFTHTHRLPFFPCLCFTHTTCRNQQSLLTVQSLTSTIITMPPVFLWTSELSAPTCVSVCECLCVFFFTGQKKNGQTETMARNMIYIVLLA